MSEIGLTFPTVAYGDLVSNVIPIAIGMSRHRVLTHPMRLFLVYIVINFVTEIVSFTLAEGGVTNLWFLHLYDLVAYILLLLILRHFSPDEVVKSVLRGLMIVYMIVWVIAKFTFEPFSASDQFMFTGIGVMFTIVTLYLLFRLATDGEPILWREYRFWMIGGVFLYFIGNVILFSVLQKFILLHPADAFTVWVVHWSLNILVNLLYARGFWVIEK